MEQLENELRKVENNYMEAVERALSLEERVRESEARICGQTFIGKQTNNYNLKSMSLKI